MNNPLGSIKETARSFTRGLMLEWAPGIAGGVINQLFHEWRVDIAKVTKDVSENKSIWLMMDAEQHEQLRDMAEKVGDLDFLTIDVVLDGVKKDFPGVASLFLNWSEAGAWLLLQIEEIKLRVRSPQ